MAPHSYWLESYENADYPPLDKDLEVDVAIVGGGITGLTAALLLQRAGRRVAVLEGRHIGNGVSGHTSAHLTVSIDQPYHQIAHQFGTEAATQVVEASDAAIDFIEKIAQDSEIDCQFRRIPGYRITETAEHLESLESDFNTLKKMGRDVALGRDFATPFPGVIEALHFKDQGLFHPMRYLQALAKAAQAQGGQIYEHTRVEDYSNGDPCTVMTSDGHTVKAEHILLATHTPIGLLPSIHTRLAPYTSYLIVARLSEPLPLALFWDTAEPYHYTRPLTPDQLNLALIGGADHKTGEASDTKAHFDQLERYARDRLPVESIEHRWSAEVFEPADGLPYIGLLPGAKHIHISTGYSGTGLTFGTAGAMITADAILDRPNPWGSVFKPGRIKPVASAKRVLSENVDVAYHFAADRLSGGSHESLTDLESGEGKLIEVEGKQAAVYRDPDGKLHVISPVCRHAGCIVHWNPSEKTWDCPCHGGRYGPTGEVMSGPPMHHLETRKIEP